MTKSNRLTEAADTDSQLADAIENLAQEIRVLRDSIDDSRSSVRWGLQNDKFKSDGEPAEQIPAVDTDEIREAVLESLAQVGDQLSEIVSESMK